MHGVLKALELPLEMGHPGGERLNHLSVVERRICPDWLGGGVSSPAQLHNAGDQSGAFRQAG